ncbi:sulfotransferase 1C2-like [Limulus polyphemus]|uniref:Sulfotransferase 1C2-like n=1 Tax=Limulus polyphemus TaxID=6850 RepID=A0ABM1TGD3_LIMPO|nr:sulfotransferase 1C2-like [Limulus polyphemus]
MAYTVQKMPAYQDVDGFRLTAMFSPDIFRAALQYQPRADDLFIVTYPKCGTTWMQNIVLLILNKGIPLTDFLQFQKATPFLEMTGPDSAKHMKRPGAIKTHLPFRLQPYSPEAKYIYVVRNPKDCCVSFYYHTKNSPGYHFQDGTFDDFFEIFIRGETDYGDYFDHLLSWYEHRNDPNVLFITFEEMKMDMRTAVLKIAKFLGIEYAENLENDDDLLKRVLVYSSFDYMRKSHEQSVNEFFHKGLDSITNDPNVPEGLKHVIKSLKNSEQSSGNIPNIIRKGIIGDWKNHFTEEQSQRMDDIFFEKTKGTEVRKLWEGLENEI